MRILLTVHALPTDEQSLGFGAQVARHANEPPTVLTVIRNEVDRPQANALLERARQLLVEVPNVRTKVRTGSAATEIICEAEEGAFDLIILGEGQKANALARPLTSSITMRVVEHAPCAVLVAKGKARPIQRILLCDSGAEGPLAELAAVSNNAGRPGRSQLARFTGQLADLLQGEEEITVLHVMSQISAGPGVSGRQLRATATELIEEHAPEGEMLKQDLLVLQRPGIHSHPQVRHGLVLDEIAAEARAGDYDLVVIGAHRGARWQRILLEDLAHKIVARLDRPILVVR